MFDGHNWMWGMHWLWWIVWIAIGALVVFLILRGRSAGGRPPSGESPLEILERRYAAGEITTEEFEDRKKRLERR